MNDEAPTEPEASPDDVVDPSDGTDAAMLRRARQRHGTVGMVLAGGMLGLDKMLGRPVKEEIPAVWEADGEPTDIDSDGISVPVDDERTVHSQPGMRTGNASRRIVKRRR